MDPGSVHSGGDVLQVLITGGPWALLVAILLFLARWVDRVGHGMLESAKEIAASIREVAATMREIHSTLHTHDAAEIERHGATRERIDVAAKETRHAIRNSLQRLTIGVDRIERHLRLSAAPAPDDEIEDAPSAPKEPPR